MPQSTFNSNETHTPDVLWKTPVRLLHWLTAASMAGAAILTSQGDIGHAALGWIALGALLIQLFGCRNDCTPSPTLWLVTADVVILDLSGLLAPQGTIHLGATLVVLVLAAFYCATVLFKSLQRVTTRTGIQTTSAPGLR